MTKQQAEQIRTLLRKLRSADQSEQKVIRSRLRSLGFYLDDWPGKGPCFTVAEFNELVYNGRITTIEAEIDK